MRLYDTVAQQLRRFQPTWSIFFSLIYYLTFIFIWLLNLDKIRYSKIWGDCFCVAANCKRHVGCLKRPVSNLYSARSAGREITTRLLLAMILSRIDYRDSAEAGLPWTTVAPSRSAVCRGLRVWTTTARHTLSLIRLHRPPFPR